MSRSSSASTLPFCRTSCMSLRSSAVISCPPVWPVSPRRGGRTAKGAKDVPPRRRLTTEAQRTQRPTQRRQQRGPWALPCLLCVGLCASVVNLDRLPQVPERLARGDAEGGGEEERAADGQGD